LCSRGSGDTTCAFSVWTKFRFSKENFSVKRYIVCAVVGFFLFVLSLAAQTPSTGLTSAQVTPLIQFSDGATDAGGSP
jgi:hypothetical protein